MRLKVISLFPLQVARALGLVRSVAPAQLAEDKEQWVLLVNGRGFTRLVRDEPLHAPNLIRPIGWDAPRPMTFRRREHAEAYGRHVGLLPQQARWRVKPPVPKLES